MPPKRKVTKRKLKRSVQTQQPAVNAAGIGLGAGLGAGLGTASGIMRAKKTEKRIPGVISDMTNRANDKTRRYTALGNDYARWESEANQKAYSGTTGRDEARFQRENAKSYGDRKLGFRKDVQSMEDSGALTRRGNRLTLERRLRNAPQVASARTKKRAIKGGAAGAALSLIAQLVAAEMRKKK